MTFMVLKTVTSADNDGMLDAMKTFFVRRHIRTMTASDTC